MSRKYGPRGYVIHKPVLPQPRSSKGADNKIRTKFRMCRLYNRDKTTKRKDDNNDSDSIASEKEIFSDLDEEALSELPLHLQNNMREVHAERVKQWQENKYREKQSQRQHQFRYLHRQREKLKQNQKEVPELDLKPRDNERSKYMEKWFKNMMAWVAATKEQGTKMLQEVNADSLGPPGPENVTWCPVRHTWVPAYFGQGHGEKSTPTDGDEVGGRSPGSRTRLCGIGSDQTSPMSEAETAVTEKDYFPSRSGLSHNGYMWWRCSGPYYEIEARGLQKGCQSEKKFVKKHRSLISKAFNSVSARAQILKQIVKK